MSCEPLCKIIENGSLELAKENYTLLFISSALCRHRSQSHLVCVTWCAQFECNPTKRKQTLIADLLHRSDLQCTLANAHMQTRTANWCLCIKPGMQVHKQTEDDRAECLIAWKSRETSKKSLEIRAGVT